MQIVHRAVATLTVAAAALIGASRAVAHATPAPRAHHRLRHHAPRSVWDSVFTAEQAKRGEAVFRQSCLRCHKETLKGDGTSAPLAGKEFFSNWSGSSAFDLHDRVLTTMPSDSAGTLNRQQVSDVVAYLFAFNGFPSGTAELPADTAVLKDIRIESKKP